MTVHNALWAIPLLPFAGFLVAVFMGRFLPRKLVQVICCGAVLGSFVVAVQAFLKLGHGALTTSEAPWIVLPTVNLLWQLNFDHLSGVMTLVVTGVGFLIHLYSVGYMGHDPRVTRYFSYLNLFTGFMLMLLLGQNLMVMFVGWEGVGLCSYLLIGFWYDKTGTTEPGTGNALAGNKAFIVNRIGDWGFTIGVLLLFVSVGTASGTWTLDIPELKGLLTGAGSTALVAGLPLTAIGILMFIGATGKSAQVPLYVWLPDAMAGPTPVSALIHAATMVTAGVYMVCRMGFLFEQAPAAMGVVAGVGALTALMAATIGICQTDIKKVLAYSTVSQLGFMFIGAGVGAFAMAIFHVVTHAFFKACLFLGSGSVIHGCGGEQDIRKMGGLKKYMPITHATFLIACIAIAGVPFFSGFFSKDAILSAAWTTHLFGWAWYGKAVCLMGLTAAVITAFYMFRLYILTFTGEYRGMAAEGHGHGDHHGQGTPHESPWTMTLPLVVLALLSIVGGYGFVGVAHAIEKALPIDEHVVHVHSDLILVLSIAAAALGIGGAFWFYKWRTELPAQVARSMPELYTLVRDKYRMDEAYWAGLITPLLAADEGLGRFDNGVIDGAVNQSARVTAGVSHASGIVDNEVVDGAVNGTAWGTQAAGRRLRRLQTGNIKTYIATAVVGGLFVMAFYILLINRERISEFLHG